MRKQQQRTNYSNLLEKMQWEAAEVSRQDYGQIAQALAACSPGTARFIRQSISVTKEELALSRKLAGQLAQMGELVNRSQLYRAGLQLLRKLATNELGRVIRALKKGEEERPPQQVSEKV